MAKQTGYFTDGLKSSLLTTDDPSVWTFYEGGPRADVAIAYRNPWVYSAVEMVANGVETMPWTMTLNGEIVTSSDDYDDPFGWLARPDELFAKVARSLEVYGCAYVLKIRTRARITELRYLAPDTITVTIDKVSGKPTFKRVVNGQPFDLTTEDVMYFWLPDPSVEAGPPTVWPVKSALAPTAVLDSLAAMSAAYFQREMIHPHVFLTQGVIPESERLKLEGLWSRMVTGLKNAFRTVFLNAEKLTPVEIGGGLEDLGDNGIAEQCQREIAAALKIPWTLLTSEAANYATAQSDTQRFYVNVIVPICDLIGEVLEDQLLPPGYAIQFHPESLDAFQEDEAQRASAVATYTSAGMPLIVALDILGIDLTDEQRAAIEGASTTTTTPAPMFEQAQPEVTPVGPSPLETEMLKWQRKALHYVERGKPADGPFETTIISDGTQAYVRGKLHACTTPAQVRAVFGARQMDDEWSMLAHELKRANDLLEAVNDKG